MPPLRLTLAHHCQRVIEPLQLAQGLRLGNTQPVIHRDRQRIDKFNHLIVAAQRLKRAQPATDQIPVLRIERERVAIRVGGLLPLPCRLVALRENHSGLERSRVERNRTQRILHGLIKHLQPVKRRGEVRVKRRIFGPQDNRLTNQPNRLAQFASLHVHHTLQVQRIRLLGVDLENAVVQRACLVELSLAMKRQRIGHRCHANLPSRSDSLRIPA